MQALTELVPQTRAEWLSDKFVVVQDSVHADGSFVVLQLLATWLGASRAKVSSGTPPSEPAPTVRNAVVVSTLHTRAHYEAILKKLGVSRDTVQADSDRFTFIDHGSTVPEAIATSHDESKASDATALKALFLAISTAAARSTSHERNVLIVVDDLLALRVSAESDQEFLSFVHAIHMLAAKSQWLSLVVLDHADAVEHDGASLAVNIGAYLSSAADMVCQVRPLETGLSRDIHGKLTIFERKRVTGAHSGQSAISETAELQYRVNDGSVRVGRVGVAV